MFSGRCGDGNRLFRGGAGPDAAADDLGRGRLEPKEGIVEAPPAAPKVVAQA